MAKVVVWTQAYNAEKTLRRAMDSILQQTYPDFEYYVLNNGSEDGTGAIIKEYAEKDPRVIPLSVEENSITASKAFFLDIAKTKNIKWLCWCDADDCYTHDFLEKSIDFAEKENLKLVAAGYDYIHGVTNKVLKTKALKNNLILEGNGFTDYFVEYRGFTTTIWAKLIDFSFYLSIISHTYSNVYQAYTESSGLLALFKQSSRVGILKNVMYHYYQYPSSLIRTVDSEFFFGYNQYWDTLKEYIASYGPISIRNMDFLYAVYLSLIDERLHIVYNSALSLDKKIEYICSILDNKRSKETFSRRASSEFHNLAARKDFLNSISQWVESQNDVRKLNNLICFQNIICTLQEISNA